jgi:hypothetical protein
MIPQIFLIPPALGCLFAARYAAFYWEISAELWSVLSDMSATADIVPFPLVPRTPQPAASTRTTAEIVRFAPSER